VNAKEWTEWFLNNRTWAARKGSRVTKVVISDGLERDWDRAYLDYVLGEHGLSLNEKAVAHLCDVPVMFTSKLPAGRVMWVLEGIGNDRIPSASGPARKSREAS
jgi:hypothetical protein